MRPVRLTIGGLNSFESSQTIDFEALSSKGLFGIFGPTGSGKSTIIDGIVMSLYGPGSIPRGTKDFINTECDQAELEFVFRTAVEGVVREIEIRRVFRRQGEGYRSHQSRLVLRTLDGEILLIEDKQNEVNHKIQDILGLSDSEFLKMVVLPQGKFSEFIQLDPKDRRNMLQNLFGLEIYGDRLTERLKRVLGRLQSQRDQLEGQLAAYAGVDQEQLTLLKETAVHWDQRTHDLEREVQRLKAAHDALSQMYERQKRFQALKLASVRHEEGRDTYLGQRDRLAQQVRAAVATEAERHFGHSLRLFEESQRLEASAALDYKSAKAALELNGAAFKELEQAYNNLPIMKHEAALVKNRWTQVQAVRQLKLDREKAAALVAAQSDQFDAERLKLESMDQAWTESTLSLTGLTDLQEKAGLSSKAAEAFLAAQDRRDKRQAEAQNLMRLESALAESQKSLVTLTQALSASQGLVTACEASLQACVAEMESDTLQREQLRDQFERLQQRKLAQDAELETLKAQVLAMGEDELALEAMKAELLWRAAALEEGRARYNASLAARLRTTLKDGDPCPVCGHHYSPLEVQLQTEADTAWLTAFEKEDQALAIMRHQEEQLRDSLEKRQRRMTLGGEHGGEHGGERFEVLEVLERLKAEADGLSGSIESVRSERGRCDVRLEALKKEQASLQSQVKALRDQTEQAQARLSGQHQAHAVLASKQDMALDALAQHEQALQHYLETWHDKPVQDTLVDEALERLFSDLVRQKSESEQRLSEIQRLQKERERKGEEKMKQLQRVNASTLELEQLKSVLKQIEASLDRLVSEVGEGIEAETLEAELNGLNLRIETTESRYPVAQAERNALQAESERLKTAWMTAEAALKAGASQLEESRQRFEEKWRGAGFEDVISWRAALLMPGDVQNLTKWIQDYEVQGRTLKEKLEEYQDLITSAVIEETALDDAASASAEAAQAWTQAIEARSTAAEALKAMTQAFEQKKEAENQMAAAKREAGYFEVLQKLLRGNRFVEFLAASQLDYILKEASRRLMIMTANRYRLEVDSRGNFRISDHHQGGVSRDLRSLSGGETFMASLALALAMSSRLQLRGKIRLETFLLDEGFGSLDASLLDVVMHSLETLIGDQLSVGLISHVEALKARVPVRLDVTPAEPGVSGTRVQVVVN